MVAQVRIISADAKKQTFSCRHFQRVFCCTCLQQNATDHTSVLRWFKYLVTFCQFQNKLSYSSSKMHIVTLLANCTVPWVNFA